MILNDKTYDRLKSVALLLPFFITFVGAFGEIWQIPNVDKIVLTLSALNALLGGIVKVSNAKYNKTDLIEQYEQEEENALEFETNEEGEE